MNDVAQYTRVVVLAGQHRSLAISAEIEATRGYESVPPEIGSQPVPDVRRKLCGRRVATIDDCLFTDPIR